jgi:chromosome segregation ATPase
VSDPGDSSGLEAVADELYGLPASEFTSARDSRVASARQAGDPQLAGEIKKLRRPTASAWLTNQLVRERRQEITALLELGSALRDAQAQLAGEDLRRLSQQGQQIVTALGREARQIAVDREVRVADDTLREVEETLHAALADPAASAAVSAGHLTAALHYAGFGSLEGDRPLPAKASVGKLPARPPDVEKSARHEAQAELTAAGRELGEQERRLDRARQQQERLDHRVRNLSEELEQLRADASEAGAAVREAERALQAAERRLAQAQASVDGRW